MNPQVIPPAPGKLALCSLELLWEGIILELTYHCLWSHYFAPVVGIVAVFTTRIFCSDSLIMVPAVELQDEREEW